MPGRDLDVGDLGAALRRAPDELGEGAEVGVVLDLDREAEALARLGGRVDPDPAGEDRGAPAPRRSLRSIGAGQAHARPDHAVAIDARLVEDLVDELGGASRPWSAEWSTSSSRQVSARTVCERSETATRRWRWPKSIPSATPAERFERDHHRRAARRGPRRRAARRARRRGRRRARSVTIVETVERERPVIRASSARLATPRSRRASITRLRLPSRREANEPLLLLTAQSISHASRIVKALWKRTGKRRVDCSGSNKVGCLSRIPIETFRPP